MKPKRRWLLLILPLALFAWAWQAASWRPKIVGVQPTSLGTWQPQLVPGGELFGSQISISPDGRNLSSLAIGKFPDDLTLFSLVTRQKMWHRAEQGERIWPPAFSPDGQTVAVATEKSAFGRPRLTLALVLLDAATGKRRRTLLPKSNLLNMESFAFLSDSEMVVATKQGVIVVDTQTGKPIRQWKLNLPALTIQKRPLPNQSHVAADGATVIALMNGSFETAVAIYDVKTGQRRGIWTYPQVFRNPRLSPDGKIWIMKRAKDDLADVYDAQTGKKLWGTFAAENPSLPWSWSVDGRQILTAFDNRMSLLNARTGHELRSLKGRLNTQALALDSRGGFYYTLDNQGVIWRWRLR